MSAGIAVLPLIVFAGLLLAVFVLLSSVLSGTRAKAIGGAIGLLTLGLVAGAAVLMVTLAMSRSGTSQHEQALAARAVAEDHHAAVMARVRAAQQRAEQEARRAEAISRRLAEITSEDFAAVSAGNDSKDDADGDPQGAMSASEAFDKLTEPQIDLSGGKPAEATEAIEAVEALRAAGKRGTVVIVRGARHEVPAGMSVSQFLATLPEAEGGPHDSSRDEKACGADEGTCEADGNNGNAAAPNESGEETVVWDGARWSTASGGRWAHSSETLAGNRLTLRQATVDGEVSVVMPVKPLGAAPPAWVENPQGAVAGVDYAVTLTSGPYSTYGECLSAERAEVIRAAQQYVRDNLLPADRGAAGARLGMGAAELFDRFVEDRCLTYADSSVGDMLVLHTLVAFDKEGGQRLVDGAVANYRAGRMATLGLAGGGVLGVLALAFGLLKADEATKGYYTKRLFIGVPLAILGAVLLLTFFTGLWGVDAASGGSPQPARPANVATLDF
ncbi:MAG: hypothetical protein AAF790_07690 [Planctomycetota bacterium]